MTTGIAKGCEPQWAAVESTGKTLTRAADALAQSRGGLPLEQFHALWGAEREASKAFEEAITAYGDCAQQPGRSFA